MTYLGHQMTLTKGQILKLTLPGHRVYILKRLDESKTMASKLFTKLFHLSLLGEMLLTKNYFTKNSLFDLSWPLEPKLLNYWSELKFEDTIAI